MKKIVLLVGTAFGALVLTTGAAPVYADPRFNSEKVDAYELGVKGKIGRINANLALFQMDMSDFQVLEFTGVQFTTFNVHGARSRGVELELFGKLHDYVSINAAGTYAKARYNSDCNIGVSAANLASVMRNGGLRSGDAGFRDAMGVITLCDRIKDMIISGGENVYSAEVESVIAAHPSVAMVAIIGVPDKRFGEAVHAVIVPNPGPKPTLEAIRSHCQANLAGYKCPRSIELVEALPFSAMNKILKNVLREKYLARTQGDDI